VHDHAAAAWSPALTHLVCVPETGFEMARTYCDEYVAINSRDMVHALWRRHCATRVPGPVTCFACALLSPARRSRRKSP